MFNEGDKVIVLHQPDMGVGVVADPHEPTDMKRWKRRVGHGLYQPMELVPVGYYVRIDFAKKQGVGYHEESLALAE